MSNDYDLLKEEYETLEKGYSKLKEEYLTFKFETEKLIEINNKLIETRGKIITDLEYNYNLSLEKIKSFKEIIDKLQEDCDKSNTLLSEMNTELKKSRDINTSKDDEINRLKYCYDTALVEIKRLDDMLSDSYKVNNVLLKKTNELQKELNNYNTFIEIIQNIFGKNKNG